MLLKLEALLLAIVLCVVGCTGESVDPIQTVPAGKGAASPTEAVDELVAALNAPDFADASRLAVPGQSALAALAEGAAFGDVAAALRDGDEEIAANFWSGFAQQTGSFLADGVSTVDDGLVTHDDVELHLVAVTSANGETRSVLLQESDGYRIDLFASFGPGLADKMMGPVERLLTTQTEDSRLIMENLRDVVPSLLIAAELPGTSTDVSQRLLALVEVITRTG